MCDPNQYYHPSRNSYSRSSTSTKSSDQTGRYHLDQESGYSTPDSSDFASIRGQYIPSIVPPRNRQYYEPRTAGSSNRGGFSSYGDVLRNAKSHNSKLFGEYEKFRPLPIPGDLYEVDYPQEFPKNVQDLSMMACKYILGELSSIKITITHEICNVAREIEDLCSMYRLDSGSDRHDNIVTFLRFIGANHLARSYGERDNYHSGC